MEDTLQLYFFNAEDLTDARLASFCALINAAYLRGEAGMWKNDLPRTYPEEVTERIRNEQLIVAELKGIIIGSVCVQKVNDGSAGLFGMLAVDAQHTNQGIGRRLIAAAEGWAIDNGINEMQLELLAPATWEHPAKVALKKWYSRLGYSPRDNKSFNDLYPGPATFLTTACDFTLWSKALKVGDQVNDAA